MIFLDATTRSLQVNLAGAVTTNQLPIVASYLDINQTSFSAVNASANTLATNSTTAVTPVAAPASGNTRQLKYLSIQNDDTAPATVIVEYNDNGTLRQIVKATLQVNETLSFDAENGWQTITAAGAIKSAPSNAGATSTSGPSSPTAPSSTSAYLMQGLAGSITPKTTGNILVSIAGTITAAVVTVNEGLLLQGSYGTGSAPTVNTALTGTQAGAVQEFTNFAAASSAGDVHQPFNITFLIPNAVIGTALWLDIAAKCATAASDNSLVGVVITAIEF